MAIEYSKVGWDVAPYKYANPDNMNKMDKGIKDACDGVDSIVADYSKKCEMDELKYLGWVTPREYTGTRSSTDSNGVFDQHVGRVDLGTLSWSGSSSHFYVEFPSVKNFGSSEKANIYCSKYQTYPSSVVDASQIDKTIASSNRYIAIYDTSFTDPTQFRTAMSGTYLYYQLASSVEWTEGSENYIKVKSYTYTTTFNANTNFSPQWLHGFDISDIPSTAKILTKTVKSSWAWALPSITTDRSPNVNITWCCYPAGTATVTFTLDVLYI